MLVLGGRQGLTAYGQSDEEHRLSAEMSVHNGIYFDNALASSARAPASMPAKPILPSWQAYS